jgi:hypothetical protein
MAKMNALLKPVGLRPPVSASATSVSSEQLHYNQ